MSDTDKTLSPSELKVLGNVRGTEYAYPGRMRQIAAINAVMYQTAALWGYEPVDGPTLQPAEFYAVKSSDELLKDGYYVNMPGEHSYMLRPEMTPTIAYMLASAEKGLTYPVRWYSNPQIYRNERPQSGRRRQFAQFNLDRFDLAPMSADGRARADAEVIGQAIDTLGRYGLASTDVVVRLNSRALLERAFDVIAVDGATVRTQLLTVIDDKEKLPADIFASKMLASGINQQQLDALMQWLAITNLADITHNEIFNSLVKTTEYHELSQVFDILKSYGYAAYVQYDPVIVRGLGYYTGTVFEAYDRQPERSMRRAILGGGRYDDLTQKFGGGLSITGVGYGLGHVPLETVLEARGLYQQTAAPGPDYYLTTQDDEVDEANEANQANQANESNEVDQAATSSSAGIVLQLAQALRAAGYSTIIDDSITTASAARLKKQLGSANKRHARAAIIVRNSSPLLAVKDLTTGEQYDTTLEDLLAKHRR